jgi:hypothetical protein
MQAKRVEKDNIIGVTQDERKIIILYPEQIRCHINSIKARSELRDIEG